MNRFRVLALATLLAGFPGASLWAEPVSFKKQIAPVLIDHCVSCHGPKKAEGGWRVDTIERLKTPGDSTVASLTASQPAASELLTRLKSTDPATRMPFDSEPLAPETIALVEQWIAEGANFEDADAKQSLYKVIPPPTHPAAPAKYIAPLPATATVFKPDGQEIVVAGYNEVVVKKTADGALVRRIGNLPQRIYSLAFSPDGTMLAVAGGTPGRLGEVRLVRFETGEIVRVVSSSADVVFDAQFSPNGARLATASADGVVRVFNVADGVEQLTMPSHSDWIMAVAWSADGAKLASASRDKTAKAYDANTGDLLATYSTHNAPVRGVAFNADGAEVLSLGSDNKLHRWAIADSAKKGEQALAAEGYKLVRSGEWLLAATAEKKVRQWKLDGTLVREFAGANDWLLAADIHPGTKRVVAGSFDGELRLWNLDDGAAVATFPASP